MTTFNIIVITLLTIILFTSFTTSIIQRKNSTTMTGMMTAMVIGMSIGLTIGVLLGNLFRGDLLISTTISMGIGMFAGILIGMPFNTLAVLDGMLAGIMGGMMGAMLGEMITLTDAILLVKILLSVSVCSTILILLFLLQNKKRDENANLKWMIRPITTFVLLFILLVWLDQINVNSNLDHPNQSHYNHEMHIPKNQLEIEVTGFAYSPSEIFVNKSEITELILVNNYEIEHNIEIVDLPVEKIDNESEKDSHGSHSHNSAIHIHAQPNSTNSISFIPTQEGTYLFYCTIPGHKKKGMIGTITVN
ncbi:cupredoxin domain-containing protein [Evansella cellulosilytica]|uniref:Blue (Type 1) copper domain protein n=1 Tax=Evansella cellulosilytica (strain ATCC 21833 / DSM 2522 / FERM P-1141 / JCM 9156 / N-4) TaxID=649639 RepID=E6TYW1_EVAC2|nr:cupredoxin domain-containing protein [Evansella cellulosilytica]ADU31296.1 blue (type 1) copper domain protein [Evansella cellulosilytica DSM 2522]